MTLPQIVVVDPDRESAAEVAKTLSMAGMTVVATAGYGVEAFAQAHQTKPDIVLLRIEEPLVRPMQTLNQIKEAMPDLPVIAFSSDPTPRLMRQAMVAGAWDFLSAPLDEEEVEASMLRALERSQRESARRQGELEEAVPKGTVVTIFGAKGGIGKTTIASNLAISLATSAHQSVALVDMDTRFGDVAITMDVRVERSLADLARQIDDLDRDSLQEFLVKHESGVNIVPAPTRPGEWRGIGNQKIRDVVDVLAQTHDFVILDTPGTFNEQVAAALEVATMIILVTTLDMASIKDTVLALEMLHERFGNDEERIKIVLNRAGMDTGVREEDVIRTLDSELWWRIPDDIEVMKSAQLGRPIVMNKPKARVSIELNNMALALAGVGGVSQRDYKRPRRKLLHMLWPFARRSAA